jgi:hypothetical protein
MVGTHFPPIDGVFAAHTFLDKGVSGLALHRNTAGTPHHIHRIPGQAGVMDDPGSGMTLQHDHRQQTDQVIALNKATPFIEEKATIKVTVPGQPQIGVMGQYRLAGGLPALR